MSSVPRSRRRIVSRMVRTRPDAVFLEMIEESPFEQSGAGLPPLLPRRRSSVVAGRRDEALKLQEEVLTRRRKVLVPEHPQTLSAMNNLAASYFNVGRKDEAAKLRAEERHGTMPNVVFPPASTGATISARPCALSS